MPVNYPGPFEIEFTLDGWTSPVRSHKIRMSVAAIGTPAPGSLPSAITIQKAGGGTGTLDVVAAQAWSFLRQFYAASILATGYNFWQYIPGTFAKNFVATGTLATPAGTGAGITVKHQTVLTLQLSVCLLVRTVLLARLLRLFSRT